MASSVDTNLSNFKINSVASEEVLRQMEQDGLLESNQIYMTPDEDVNSSLKNLEFVGNYSATTAMLSVKIDLSNYNYLAFVSHGRGGKGDLGVFFGQGLTWTTKLGDSTMSKAFAYCYWGYSFSSALLISYNGTKTVVQNGHDGFSYTTGKPSYLTVYGSSGSAEQSYITLYRSKK